MALFLENDQAKTHNQNKEGEEKRRREDRHQPNIVHAIEIDALEGQTPQPQRKDYWRNLPEYGLLPQPCPDIPLKIVKRELFDRDC